MIKGRGGAYALKVRFAGLPNESRECFKRVNICNRSKSFQDIYSRQYVLLEVGLDWRHNIQRYDNQLNDNQLNDNQLTDNQLTENQLNDNQLNNNQLNDNQHDWHTCGIRYNSN
jgi:hypothetical protein